MDPWKPEDPEVDRDWPFHALRLALLAAGTAGWLVEEGKPDPWASLWLALAVMLDTVGQLPPPGGHRPRLVTAAALAALLALRQAGHAALAIPVMAVLLGGPRVLAERWAGLWTAGIALAGALQAAIEAHDAATALYTAAGFLVTGWFGRLYAGHLAEQERHREALAALEQAQARLTELAARAHDLAAERERQRLLGEVHDALGHALTANLL